MKEKRFNLYYGDAIEFMRNFDSNSIDCVVTDPPYLINYKEWDSYSFEWHELWLYEVERILKPGGAIYSFMGFSDKTGTVSIGYKFSQLMEKYFIVDYRNVIVWARQKGRGSSKHLKSNREDIYYGYKKGGTPIWNNLKTLREVITPYVKDGRPRGWFVDETGKRVRWTGLGNVWVYSSPQWNHKTEKQFHSAQKPIMLIERLIRLISNENDIVLDPFAGSGTTGLACLLSNRKFIGIENNKEYFDLAYNRLKNFDISKFQDYNSLTKIERS